MSNELVLEIKFEQKEAIMGIVRVQDALVSFEKTVKLTASTYRELSTAGDTLISQTEQFEKAMGVNYAAMFDLIEETNALTDVIKNNEKAFENSEAKASLMKKVVQEQIDKYIEYGHEVPRELQEIANKYNVLSTAAIKASEAQEKVIEEMKKKIGVLTGVFETFFKNLEGLGKKTGIGEDFFGALATGAEMIGKTSNQVLEMGENFEDVGKIVGPIFENLKGSFMSTFSSMRESGSGIIESLAGGFGSLFSNLKGGLSSVRETISGLPTGIKFSAALVGAEMVAKGIEWVGEKVKEAQYERIAEIEKKVEIEGKAFNSLIYIKNALKEKSEEQANAFKKEWKEMSLYYRNMGYESGQATVLVAAHFTRLRKSLEEQDAAEAKLAKEREARKKAIEDYSRSLGFMSKTDKTDVKNEMGLMTDSLKGNTAQYERNPELVDSLIKKIEELKVKAKQTGEAIPDVLLDQEKILKNISLTNSLKESMGILSQDTITSLNNESDIMVKIIDQKTSTQNLNKEQIENMDKNTVVTEKMKEAIQAQLDKYEKLAIEAPKNLKGVADAHGIISSKQEELKKKTDDLLASMGILSSDGMTKLKDETASLVATINQNADAFANNETKANLMKEQIQAQLDAYEKLGEKAPEDLTKLAKTYNVVSSAAEAYDDSLGFLSKSEITKEMDNLANSLERTKAQWKDNPELIQNTIDKMNKIEKDAKKAGTELTDAFKNGKTELEAAYDSTKVLNGEQQLFADVLGMSNTKFKEFSETTKKIGETVSAIGTHGKEVVGFLTDTGIVSGETAKALGSLVDGVSKVGAGFTELATNPIGGAMKILGGAVDFVSGLFSLFSGDDVGEAIDKERQFIDISEEMEEKIRKLEESIGDTHAATSLLMNEIIKDAKINANNFDNYVKRTHDILLDLDNGKISMEQAQESIGKSFNELLANAQKLGTEGSKEMINLMRDLRNRGIEVAEIQQYVNAQLKTGIDAFGKYLDTFGESTDDIKANFKSMGIYALGLFNSLIEEGATFLEAIQAMGDQLTKLSQLAKDNGLEVSGGLKELLDMQDFINQNKELVERLSATTEMLNALGNTGYLTAEIFNQFQLDAQTQFEALAAKTDNVTQAYQMMGPQLGKLAWYATQYGYQLDDNTKKLIAEAQQHGVNMVQMIPAEDKMVALMEELVTVIGGKIPYAMDNMANSAEKAFERARKSAARLNTEVGQTADNVDNYKPGYPDNSSNSTGNSTNDPQNHGGRPGVGNGPGISAAEGYTGWISRPTPFLIGEGGEPEFVNIVPRSKLSVYPVNEKKYPSRNGDIIFEHISLYSENGEELVREFMAAIKNNKYGVQNLIRKVVQ